MRRAAGLLVGLAAIAVVVVIVVVATSGGDDADPGATGAAAEGTPTQLTVAVESLGSGDFDVKANADELEVGFVQAGVLDPVLTVAEGGGPGPGLAESWEMDPDGKRWTFKLREGVKFHDGSELSSADVKFTLDRALEDDSKAINREVLVELVKEVSTPDAQTVVVELNRPDPEFWAYLTITKAGNEGLVMPSKYIADNGIEAWREKPIGTGAWKFDAVEPGVSYELSLNPDYWGDKPQFDTLRVVKVPEEESRVAMVKTGEADMVFVSADAANELDASGIKTFKVPAAINTTYGLWGHWDPKHPFNDIDVRKALSLAINREELADELFSGFATPAGAYMTFPSNDYYDETELAPDAFDPDAAKELLAKAGYADGFKTKIYASQQAGTDVPSLAQAIAGYWEAIGVDAEIVPIEHTKIGEWYNSGLPTPKELMGTVSFWVMTSPLTTVAFNLVHDSKASVHQSRFPDLDALIKKCQEAIEPEEKQPECLEAAAMSHDKYVLPGLLYQDAIVAVSDQVSGYTALPGTALPAPYTTVTRAE